MITPVLEVNYLNGEIVVTDSTIYGGANPPRSSYIINYEILYKGIEERHVSLNDYDPITVNQVVGKVGDGRYIITMKVEGAETFEHNVDVIIYDNLKACVESKLNDFKSSACDKEKANLLLDEYNKTKLMLDIIEEIDQSGSGYDSAQCILEYAFTFCKTSNCICGC